MHGQGGDLVDAVIEGVNEGDQLGDVAIRLQFAARLGGFKDLVLALDQPAC